MQILLLFMMRDMKGTITKIMALLAVLLLVAVAELPAKRKVYLVSVGIADYPGEQNDLRLPVNDAMTMQQLYRKNGNAQSVLLTNEQATRENVLGQMRTLFRQAGADDIIVLFFSGHGYKGGFVAYDDKMDYEAVRRVMAESRCRNKMIFADACFSGKMRGKKRGGGGQRPEMNVMLFLSSRDNETSIERSSMKNGFFTACLQRALGGGADVDRNRVITARELFNAVSRGVKRISNDRQHPVMWGKFNDSMPVMTW